MDEHVIAKISRDHAMAGVDNQKLALFRAWLKQCPHASWDDVILALQKSGHLVLAVEVERKRDQVNVGKPSDQQEATDGVSSGEIGLPVLEIPHYSLEEDLDEVIRLHTPRAQPCKGSSLSNQLERFCPKVDVILHTVNGNEKWAVLKYMSPPELYLGKPLTDRVIDLEEPNWIVLGMFAGYRCAMIQTDMGVNSRDEVEDALDLFPNAQAVLAIGVAYGCDPEKVKYGDVLVSKVIDGIGNIKHTKDGLTIYRDSNTRLTHVSQLLKNVFAKGEGTWKAHKGFECTKNGRLSKVHSGKIISDCSLVDNKDVRDSMVSATPEAIGGEMEGVTLVGIQKKLAKSRRAPRNVDVTVIKGVADYADGNKRKEWQFTAALAAADYTHHKLEMTAGNLFTKDDRRNHYCRYGILSCSCIAVAVTLTSIIITILLPSNANVPNQPGTSVATLNSWLPVGTCNKSNNPPDNLKFLKANAPFYGRESNISHLRRLLQSESVHIIGINGPPGFGKSTIAAHLGWEMVSRCIKVGYIDMEGRSSLFSYALEIFKEKQLAVWAPPRHLSRDEEPTDDDIHNVIAKGILRKWYNREIQLLIIDNCDHMLSDEKERKFLVEFLSSMVEENTDGKIIVTSNEKLNLVASEVGYFSFSIGSLSVEASVKLLQFYSSNITEDEAKDIAKAVENCPIALVVVSGLLQVNLETLSNLVTLLNDRKKTLEVLHDAENKNRTFVALMDIVFDLLEAQEQITAMFCSFFPNYFANKTAAEVLETIITGTTKYDCKGKDVPKSLKVLFVKSLLEKLSFERKVERYKMHRLIKIYFMDRADKTGDEIEVEFNSSFRLHFSNLRLRRRPLDEIKAELESELLSDYGRHNFYYLNNLLLSNFKNHLYSEDEIIYLAIAFHKGLIDYDYKDFKKLLEKFTSPGWHVGVLPDSWEWSKENFLKIESDFSDRFFVNVLCNVTSKDVCVHIYLDLLYKVYMGENCSEVYEDTFEETCHMVDCYRSEKYFYILDHLSAFEKCLSTEFCRSLLTVRYMCTAFERLKTPGQYSLISFMLLVCLSIIFMVVSCCKIKKLPTFVLKQFCYFLFIILFFVGFTYTRFIRKSIGMYWEAPVEVHTRNAIAILIIIGFIFTAAIRFLFKLFGTSIYRLYAS